MKNIKTFFDFLPFLRVHSCAAPTTQNTSVHLEQTFGGVALSKLNEIAKVIHPGNWVTLDQWGFLVLHYKSNHGRQTFHTQLDLDKALKLCNLHTAPQFDGQRYSHADKFVKEVNQSITFSKPQK